MPDTSLDDRHDEFVATYKQMLGSRDPAQARRDLQTHYSIPADHADTIADEVDEEYAAKAEEAAAAAKAEQPDDEAKPRKRK